MDEDIGTPAYICNNCTDIYVGDKDNPEDDGWVNLEYGLTCPECIQAYPFLDEPSGKTEGDFNDWLKELSGKNEDQA